MAHACGTGVSLDRLVRLSRREMLGAGVLSTSLLSLVVLLCWSQGALGVARNDDWAYYRVLFRLAKEGVFSLDGWTHMFFAGQAYLFLPLARTLGSSMAVMQIGVALLGAIGLWCTYILVRDFLPVGPSLLSLGCLALGPIFGSLAVSFMTDVPAFSLQAVALLLGSLALRARQCTLILLTMSLACTTLAFTVREFAVAPGLAILVATWSKQGDRPASFNLRLAVLTGSWVALLLYLYSWRRALQHSIAVNLEVLPSSIAASVSLLVGLLLTTALLLTPVVLAAGPFRLIRLAWQRNRLSLLVLLAAISVLTWWRTPLLPGYFEMQASYDSAVLGSATPFMPVLAWKSLWFVALGCTGLLCLVARLALSTHDGPRGAQVLRSTLDQLTGLGGTGIVLPFVVISFALSAASILFTDAPYFDRYLMAFLPFLGALVLHAAGNLGLRTRSSTTLGWISLAAIAAYSLALIHAVAAVDGAKWQLANRLVALGYEPSDIAGSFEWWGLHYDGPVVPEGNRPDIPPWWLSMFGERKACAIVAYANPSGEEGQILGIDHVTTLIGSTVTLVAKDVPGCDLGRASKLAGY